MKAHAGAYTTCRAKFPGLLDDLFDNQIKYWKDENAVINEAAKYTNRREFKNKSSGAYKSALTKFPHVLHVVFGAPLVKKWDLCDLIELASKYSSRTEFLSANCGAHAAFSNFPGELEKLFPHKYRYWKNEEDIRKEASKYRTKSEFIANCVGAYGAALNLGIIDDLGFEPSGPGFDTTEPAYLYITNIKLISGGIGTMFGVTNRSLKSRYTSKERKVMFDLTAFLFESGKTALELETLLRREFVKFAIPEGESPLLFKKGTSGEILQGVPIANVKDRISTHCTHLDPVHVW